MIKSSVKNLDSIASECFGLWRLSGCYKSGGVYISTSLKELNPVFLDNDFLRDLMFLIRKDRTVWYRFMIHGLEHTFYPYGIRDELYDELRSMCTCRKMVVDDRNGFTVRMLILILFALMYEFPFEFLPDSMRGDAHE